MSSWSPAAVAGIITAVTGLVTAIGAVVVALRAHGRINTIQQAQAGSSPPPTAGPRP